MKRKYQTYEYIQKTLTKIILDLRLGNLNCNARINITCYTYRTHCPFGQLTERSIWPKSQHCIAYSDSTTQQLQQQQLLFALSQHQHLKQTAKMYERSKRSRELKSRVGVEVQVMGWHCTFGKTIETAKSSARFLQ